MKQMPIPKPIVEPVALPYDPLLSKRPLPKTPPPRPPTIICRTPSVYCGASDRRRFWLDVGHIVFFVLLIGAFVGIGIAAMFQ